ncbi:MAG: hypothetical protein HY927_01140 [Elusimicrobia bacterium]|nr:hypothetical protein [Elusimicrobiota bacterium]
MRPDLLALCSTAAALGCFHTLLGPDHYLPFIAMSKARGWSRGRTAAVTLLCGLGHVGSSVAIGLGGVALGAAVGQLVPIEAGRGRIAAWLLLGFGLLYAIWGLKKAWSGEPHSHRHAHADGVLHGHDHGHLEAPHAHPHGRAGVDITPWVVFTVLVFGPCEPLIPVVMYPALAHSWAGLALVTAVFAATTVGCMLGVVMLAHHGLSLVRWAWLDRYTHALAGGAVFACGVAVVFLGL